METIFQEFNGAAAAATGKNGNATKVKRHKNEYISCESIAWFIGVLLWVFSYMFFSFTFFQCHWMDQAVKARVFHTLIWTISSLFIFSDFAIRYFIKKQNLADEFYTFFLLFSLLVWASREKKRAFCSRTFAFSLSSCVFHHFVVLLLFCASASHVISSSAKIFNKLFHQRQIKRCNCMYLCFHFIVRSHTKNSNSEKIRCWRQNKE